MGMLSEILSTEKPIAVFVSTSPTPSAAVQSERSTTLADQPAADSWPHATIPPPIACPICDCSAIWSSIYEPTTFKCCDCDPPPGGNLAWHHQRGGWAFVGRRIVLVEDVNGRLEWENFPRLGAESQPGNQSKRSSTVTANSPNPGGITYWPRLKNDSSTREFRSHPKPHVPPSVTDTRRKCPNCKSRFILPELRTMTGEQCWECWSMAVM